jgi:hypothetical protein
MNGAPTQHNTNVPRTAPAGALPRKAPPAPKTVPQAPPQTQSVQGPSPHYDCSELPVHSGFSDADIAAQLEELKALKAEKAEREEAEKAKLIEWANFWRLGGCVYHNKDRVCIHCQQVVPEFYPCPAAPHIDKAYVDAHNKNKQAKNRQWQNNKHQRDEQNDGKGDYKRTPY